MIAPQEIRIGNFVHSPYDGHVVKVNAADIFLMANQHHREARFEPIELTEDWLEKFGLRDSETGYEAIVKQTKFSAIKAKGFFSVGLAGPFGLYLVKIKYVHQFQNLIHSLCGEELKMKEA